MIDPLGVQTSSALFSFLLNLSRTNRTRGIVIGIGNDIDLWCAMLPYFESLLILESNDQWLCECQARTSKNVKIFDEYTGNIVSKKITLDSFDNEILPSAQNQSRVLKKLLNNKSAFDRYLKSICRTSLFKKVTSYDPDWIYVDGPLGGYDSPGSFSPEPNTGRLDVIACCFKSLKEKQRWIIIDDCERLIEQGSVALFQDSLVLSQTIKLGRTTLGFSV